MLAQTLQKMGIEKGDTIFFQYQDGAELGNGIFESYETLGNTEGLLLKKVHYTRAGSVYDHVSFPMFFNLAHVVFVGRVDNPE